MYMAYGLNWSKIDFRSHFSATILVYFVVNSDNDKKIFAYLETSLHRGRPDFRTVADEHVKAQSTCQIQLLKLILLQLRTKICAYHGFCFVTTLWKDESVHPFSGSHPYKLS